MSSSFVIQLKYFDTSERRIKEELSSKFKISYKTSVGSLSSIFGNESERKKKRRSTFYLVKLRSFGFVFLWGERERYIVMVTPD